MEILRFCLKSAAAQIPNSHACGVVKQGFAKSRCRFRKTGISIRPEPVGWTEIERSVGSELLQLQVIRIVFSIFLLRASDKYVETPSILVILSTPQVGEGTSRRRFISEVGYFDN
ncbi:MAG: hypothetical protein IPL65_18555 [Lewinellaceae bacterium]|nr:hypothetical protein [Lewinellaceae bacterium]